MLAGEDIGVSTHSRPKAAGHRLHVLHYVVFVSTHSRPKAAGRPENVHKASKPVSTHSRPKAAGLGNIALGFDVARFNSQPPEGGWLHSDRFLSVCSQFQLTAARRRLVDQITLQAHEQAFQLTAARRRLGAKCPAHGLPWPFQLTAARRRLASAVSMAASRS